jgi:hypothetical protein
MIPMVVYNHRFDQIGIWYGPAIFRIDVGYELIWPFAITQELGTIYYDTKDFLEEWIIVGSL